MKRICITVLSLCTLLSLCACRAPQKAIVPQKSSERILESAEKETPQATTERTPSLAEQYGIPETYQYEATGRDGAFTVKVDAPITIPDGDKMPICRVKAANFSQEQVDFWWKELVGDAEMMQWPRYQSKEDIAQSIEDLQELMKDPEELERQRLLSVEEAQEELDRLKEIYPTARMAGEDLPCYGKLEEIIDYEDREQQSGRKLSTYTGFSAYEKGIPWEGKMINVTNNSDLKEPVTVKDKKGAVSYTVAPLRFASIHFTHNGSSSTHGRFGVLSPIALPLDANAESDKEALVGLSPQAALESVQSLLDRTNSQMIVDRLFFMEGPLYQDETETDIRYAYYIHCARKVAGIFVADSGYGSRTPGNAATAATWGYERMSFQVDRDGIAEMSWTAPLDVLETVNADAALLPFAQIQEIFEKMVMVKYELSREDSFEIDRIELSLQRIADQNSYENGLLVPVWNFYKKEELLHGIVVPSVLSINAVDGTVIDLEFGN